MPPQRDNVRGPTRKVLASVRLLRYSLLVSLISLVIATAAQANAYVIYGVNDANFATLWPVMEPRISDLGISQVGLWVRYRCQADSNDYAVRNLRDDLGQVPASQPAMVQLLGSPSCTPKTAADRRACAESARALVSRYPQIREIQVWNEPELGFWNGTVDQYVALLANVHDALRGTGVKVLGPGFSPHGLLNDYPKMGMVSFAKAVRRYYRTHHRKAPLLDGFAYHPYWGFDRKTTNTAARTLDFFWGGLPQTSPSRGLRFWWTETGNESKPPTEDLPGYFGDANSWSRSDMLESPEDQANRVGLIALKARANPLVAADFNFQLGDDPNLARWQSGLYYVDGVPKPAYYSFSAAIRK